MYCGLFIHASTQAPPSDKKNDIYRVAGISVD